MIFSGFTESHLFLLKGSNKVQIWNHYDYENTPSADFIFPRKL